MSISRLMQMGAAGAGEDSYWIALLGGAGNDRASGVAIDSANNILTVGNQGFVAGVNTNNILIAKHDSFGVLQWNRTLGGAGIEAGFGVATDSLDNVIVVGYTTTEVNGESFLIAKYNSSGTLIWKRTLGEAFSYSNAYGVAVDSADNIIVVGRSDEDFNRAYDFIIAKYNSSGVFQWDKALGKNADQAAYGVAVDSADNIIVVGYTQVGGAGSNDFLIAKYNSSGTLQWRRTLGGGSNDFGYGVAIDSANNIIVSGHIDNVGAGGSDFLVTKYNSSGVIQWSRTLGGSSDDFGRAVAVDSADNIIVNGILLSDGAGNQDFLIAKYDSSGTFLWDRTLGGSLLDEGLGVAVDSSDNIVIAGLTNSDGAGETDALIAKLPPDGSGTGTYGSFVYQEAVLTSSVASVTDLGSSDTSIDVALTDADAIHVSDSAVSFASELIEITP